MVLLVANAVCVGSGRARDGGWGDRWEFGGRLWGGYECALC